MVGPAKLHFTPTVHSAFHFPLASPSESPPVSMEMEMEGSGGIQMQQQQQPPSDEAITKRARKRSRYLSPPYDTDTHVQEKQAEGEAAGSHKQQPHVLAAEVLSGLRAAALCQGQGMDAAAIRFLAMYKKSNGGADSHPTDGAAAALKITQLNNVGPGDGSLTKKDEEEKNPHPPPAATATEGVVAAPKKRKRRNKQKGAIPPIPIPSTPPPLPKLPLMDIRSNLEKMILSLSVKATAASANSPAVDSHSLVGEMQHLLAKVDKVLQVQGASATPPHHA